MSRDLEIGVDPGGHSRQVHGMQIPLEDTFADVLSKAANGLGLNAGSLAAKTGLGADKIRAVLDGEVDESAIEMLASPLGLAPNAVVALALGKYTPPNLSLPTLVGANTTYEDMTVNAYLVWDPATLEGTIFDTGSDADPLLEAAKAHEVKVTQILITHSHGDHIFDLDRLVEKTGAKVFTPEKEPVEGAESFAPGKSFAIGGLQVDSRITWGHSTGGVTYVISGLKVPVAICGDAVFAGSMGGGKVSYDDALRSNRDAIFTLPENTILCPGHGPLTTVGSELANNPFFA